MTYDYKCTHCDKEWEEEQKIIDKKLTRCPHCGKETAQRLISGGNAFILKGGSWAANGYK